MSVMASRSIVWPATGELPLDGGDVTRLMIVRDTYDPAVGIANSHAYNRVAGRCTCGDSMRAAEHRVHLVQIGMDHVLEHRPCDGSTHDDSVVGESYHEGYSAGFEDGRNA